MRQRMLLLLAVIFGLLAFVLTYRQIESEKRRISGSAKVVDLIQVKRDMVEGETITENDVQKLRTSRQEDALADSREIPWRALYQVVNHTLDNSIVKGQVLQYT